MAPEIPDRIVLKRDRDLEGRASLPWLRRAILGVITAFLVLGLANVFGQRPSGRTDDTGAASVELFAPEHLRGGLIYMARFTITAHRDLGNALLQLSPGWLESQTLNSVVPSPLGEASRDGDILFTLGHIRAGTKFRLFLHFQVNPTNVGRRAADYTLYDGSTKLVHVNRELTFYP